MRHAASTHSSEPNPGLGWEWGLVDVSVCLAYALQMPTVMIAEAGGVAGVRHTLVVEINTH